MKKIGHFFIAAIPFWIYLAVQFVVSFAGSIIASVAAVIGGTFDPQDPNSILSGEALCWISLAATVLAFVAAVIEMKLSKVKLDDFRPVKQNGKVYGLMVLFTAGAFFVLQVANALFLNLIGVTEADSTQEMLSTSGFFMAAIALSAPFVEELVFRGLMVKGFEKYFPKWFTVVGVTFLFFIMHSANMKCYALLFGLVLMLILYKTGDWLLCLMFHFIGNGMSCLVTLLPEENAEMIMYIGAGVGLVVAVVAFMLIMKVKNQPAPAIAEGELAE